MLLSLLLLAYQPSAEEIFEGSGRCLPWVVKGDAVVATEDSLRFGSRLLTLSLTQAAKPKFKELDLYGMYNVYGGGVAIRFGENGDLYRFDPGNLKPSKKPDLDLVKIGDSVFRRQTALQIFGGIPALNKWDDVRAWRRNAFVSHNDTLSFWKSGRRVFQAATDPGMLVGPLGDKIMEVRSGGGFAIWSLDSGRRLKSGRLPVGDYYLPEFQAATTRYFVCGDLYSLSAFTPDGTLIYHWISEGVGIRQIIASKDSVILTTKGEEVIRVDLP